MKKTFCDICGVEIKEGYRYFPYKLTIGTSENNIQVDEMCPTCYTTLSEQIQKFRKEKGGSQ